MRTALRHGACAFVAATLALMTCADAAAQGADTILVPPVEAVVEDGASVRLTLSLVDGRRRRAFSRPDEFDFVIIGAPRAGVLSELDQFANAGARDSATVRYTHLGGPGSEDRFTFAVQREGVTMASGVARITIRRAALSFPSARLDVGETFPGVPRTIVFWATNTGTLPLVPDFEVEGPFSVTARTRGPLAPGARVSIRLAAVPESVGTFEGALSVRGAPNSVVRLTVRSLFPVKVRDADAIWRDARLNRGRLRREILLENVGNRTVELALSAHPSELFSVAPETLTVAPESRRSILWEAHVAEAGTFSGELRLDWGAAQETVPLELTVVRGPVLEWHTNDLAWQAIEGADRATNAARITNRGDQPWTGTWHVPRPFELVDAPETVLPQTSRTLTIGLGTSATGHFSGVLNSPSDPSVPPLQLKARVAPRPRLAERATTAEAVSDPLAALRQVRAERPLGSATVRDTGFWTKRRVGVSLRPESESAVLMWKVDPGQKTNQFSLLQLHRAPAPDFKSILEEWTPVADVSCQVFDSDEFCFVVDRLRPRWQYRFRVVYEPPGEPPNLSRLIVVKTEGVLPTWWERWGGILLWLLGVGLALGLVLFWRRLRSQNRRRLRL